MKELGRREVQYFRLSVKCQNISGPTHDFGLIHVGLRCDYPCNEITYMY